MAQDPSTNSKNLVNSLAKGLRILETFTAREPELLLSEVARRATVDNATAFRMLNTLVQLGFVDRVGDTRKFRLSLKCLDLGFNAIARTELRNLAQPILRGLVGGYAEAASLAVLDRGGTVYIERVQAGLTRMAVDIRVGMRVNAYSSAIGHAIIAYLPLDAQAEILEDVPRVKLTERTLTSMAELRKRFKEVRARGYAVSDGETIPGLRAIAAPILAADGLPVAGVSIAGPSITIPIEKFVEIYSGRLLEAAARLTRAMQAGGTTLMSVSSTRDI